eukprot:6172088-Pleurochrysis_carterae.AAC.3
MLRTECELRQQGARRRDRDLGADCLERRIGNQLRDAERGDRKLGRAVIKPRRSSTLHSAANFSIVCRPYAHSSSPQKALAHTPPAPSRSPVFSRIATLPRDPTAPPPPSNLAIFSTTALRRPSLELMPSLGHICFPYPTVLFQHSWKQVRSLWTPSTGWRRSPSSRSTIACKT